MGELQSFYQSILNIRQQDKREIINRIVLEERDQLLNQVKDMAGFCKVIASQIEDRLRKENICVYWLDLNSIVEVDHVVLIAEYRYNQEVKRFLIDPTYWQFVHQDNHKLLKFSQWPSDRLDKEILEDLLQWGMTELNDNKFLNYLNSFGGVCQEISLDDYLLDNRINRKR